MKRLALPLALATVFALPGVAGAAGLSRPNMVGARAIGLGGAFTAVADDPTAVWHNPAGPAFFGDNVAYLGAELVLTQRSYTPSAQSPLGLSGQTKTIDENTAPTPLPIIGVSSRFGLGRTQPTRFALSLLAHLAYGGAISFNPSDLKNRGLLNTQILDYEITPALSYQVSDVLAVGAALRIGVNAFNVDDVESAYHATLSTIGVGIGGTLGIFIRPHRMVDIGAVYRTPLSATMSGNGPVSIVGQGMAMNRDANLSITWPQSAGLGITIKPHPRFFATLQGDWTGWSSVQTLNVNVTGLTAPPKEMLFRDSYALHLGLQGIITHYLLARLGYAIDTNAIPDETVRRENEDGLKATLSAGLGLHFWKVFIDAAFEAFVPLGPPRVIKTQIGDALNYQNEAGSYSAEVYTVELSAQIHF